MDILALISTPIPAYFTLGPLIVLLIILSSLVKKSTSTMIPQVGSSVPLQTVTSQPEPLTTPQVTKEAVQVPASVPPTPPPVEATIPPISSWKPAEPVATSQEVSPAPTPVVTQAPEAAEASTPSAEPAKPTF